MSWILIQLTTLVFSFSVFGSEKSPTGVYFEYANLGVEVATVSPVVQGYQINRPSFALFQSSISKIIFIDSDRYEELRLIDREVIARIEKYEKQTGVRLSATKVLNRSLVMLNGFSEKYMSERKQKIMFKVGPDSTFNRNTLEVVVDSDLMFKVVEWLNLNNKSSKLVIDPTRRIGHPGQGLFGWVSALSGVVKSKDAYLEIQGLKGPILINLKSLTRKLMWQQWTNFNRRSLDEIIEGTINEIMSKSGDQLKKVYPESSDKNRSSQDLVEWIVSCESIFLK